MTSVRNGISSRMMTGKPIAAIAESAQCETYGVGRLTDSLRYSKRRPEPGQLHAHEQQYARLAHFAQRLVRGRKRLVPEEIQQALRDPIALERVQTHIPAVNACIQSQSRQIRRGIGWVTHKRPARTPRGIRCRTCRNGRVRRTRHSAPCARFDTRCSTTATATSCLRASPSPSRTCVGSGSSSGSRNECRVRTGCRSDSF